MEKNNRKLFIYISILIITGFTITTILNFISFNKIIEDDIQNIASLSTTNIYSEINSELIKPIFVSLTMANDSFVKAWINGEIANDYDEIITYLNGIKQKYEYDSVFLVSNQTNIYYHTDGILKTITMNNEHDVWYYDFIASEEKYDLDIDTDEGHDNKLTVFVNCKIYDNDENLIGVTGVGLTIDKVREIMEEYNNNFNVETYLIDPTGLVQIHANEAIIEKENFFNQGDNQKHREDILNTTDSLNIISIDSHGVNGFLISLYIEELDWYLVVQKDTTIIRNAFYTQIINDILIVLVVLVLVLLTVIRTTKNYQDKINNLASTDTLTGLYNRRKFNEQIHHYVTNTSASPLALMVFDIDNFKAVNDTYGHLKGDEIIKSIATIIKQSIGSNDIAARWGGDEFAVILNLSIDEAYELAESFRIKVLEDNILQPFNVSISIGVTEYDSKYTTEEFFHSADKALYCAKSDGKNKVCIN